MNALRKYFSTFQKKIVKNGNILTSRDTYISVVVFDEILKWVSNTTLLIHQ